MNTCARAYRMCSIVMRLKLWILHFACSPKVSRWRWPFSQHFYKFRLYSNFTCSILIRIYISASQFIFNRINKFAFFGFGTLFFIVFSSSHYIKSIIKLKSAFAFRNHWLKCRKKHKKIDDMCVVTIKAKLKPILKIIHSLDDDSIAHRLKWKLMHTHMHTKAW